MSVSALLGLLLFAQASAITPEQFFVGRTATSSPKSWAHRRAEDTFQPGGRERALNRMTFRRFGLTVATVEETIRRVG